MNPEIRKYNESATLEDKEIVDLLAMVIDKELPEAKSKMWHAHPVCFLDDNMIVGYRKQKKG